ncbi:hypothetical protein B0H11DRAFT_565212 [Mycena galericulata]|nr:hypothetical protein B0H11DRAFT_565212 [Mycena galericulata]
MPNQIQTSAKLSGSSSLHDKSNGGPDSPIEHAFPNQFQFALRPIAASPGQHQVPIDPALLPLPGGADLDLRDPSSVAQARGLKPAEKVAGSRRNGKERADVKAKKRKHASSDSEDDREPGPRKRGRPAGSANYGADGTKKLLDLVEQLLPVGQKGWKSVEQAYNKWAVPNGKSKRSQSSLENKYKGYLKLKKPTGSGTCPPEVKRAHEIEDLINQRVGTRHLSDSEFGDDSDPGSSGNDVEVIEHPTAAVRTAIAQRVPTPPLRRKTHHTSTDLANRLAQAFDPDTQKAREDARAQRTFENTQILTLSQQLRDAQGVAENLRTQNTILQNRIHELERAHDRAELKLELLGMTGGGSDRGRHQSRGRSRRRSRLFGHRSHRNEPDLQRVRGKVRYPSTDDYEDDDNENENPYDTFDYQRRRSRSHNTASYRPISRRRTPTPGPSHRPRSRRTPTPGPSRPIAPTFFGRQPLISPPRPTASTVTGNAVELVVTPRRGPAMALVISPAPQNNTTYEN